MTSINEPTHCPACEFSLIKIKDQLFCKNSACPAQVAGKLSHFCKVLGIKGLGPKTLEKLEVQSVFELYYLDREEVIQALGEKIGIKVLDQLENSKTSKFSTVLEAMSIPLLGGTASKKLAAVINSFDDISEKTCKEAGLGPKLTENVLLWKDYEYPEVRELMPFTFAEEFSDESDDTATVCITGKLKNYNKKADAEALLLSKGYKLVDSVTKKLDFLIDETDGTSSKRKKAEEYGITIITDLNDLIERKKNDN